MTIYQHNSSLSGINSEVENQVLAWRESRNVQDKLDHEMDVAVTKRIFYTRRNSFLLGDSPKRYNEWLAGFGMSHSQWDEFRTKF